MSVQPRDIFAESVPSGSSGDGASQPSQTDPSTGAVNESYALPVPSEALSTDYPDSYQALTRRYEDAYNTAGGGKADHVPLSARDGQLHPGDLAGDEGLTGAGKAL